MTGSLAPHAQLEWQTLEGGTFWMGSDEFYPEERPAREASVDGFALTTTPITNRQFANFVDATGYVTVAERPLPSGALPSASAVEAAPGSLVFTRTTGPVDLQDWRQWWRWVPGAHWRWPRGKDAGPSVSDLADHPVVHIAYEDAVTYAEWVGGRLPTEVELEYAATGGSRPSPYAWGSTRDLEGRLMANTWRGSFPYLNTGANGWIGTSPVGSFPANGFGLFDCIGNVWEWTTTRYPSTRDPSGCTCSPAATPEITAGPAQRVLKGGSHLCAPEYCLRYRPAARSSQVEHSATTHIGFRVARDIT